MGMCNVVNVFKFMIYRFNDILELSILNLCFIT